VAKTNGAKVMKQNIYLNHVILRSRGLPVVYVIVTNSSTWKEYNDVVKDDFTTQLTLKNITLL